MERAALDALTARGAAHEDWHMGDFALDLTIPPPEGVFFNRMSASSHTRGHCYAPEMTTGLLHWLEASGRQVLNGSRAVALEINKVAQYAALARAGLAVPDTVACHTADQIMAAHARFGDGPVITKHNRAGKGLGVKLFRDAGSLEAYVGGRTFEPSVDGITLLRPTSRRRRPSSPASNSSAAGSFTPCVSIRPTASSCARPMSARSTMSAWRTATGRTPPSQVRDHRELRVRPWPPPAAPHGGGDAAGRARCRRFRIHLRCR